MSDRIFSGSNFGFLRYAEFVKSPFGSGPRVGGVVIGDPLDDYLAVVSLGSFPTPTPTSAVRAYYAASHGLLGHI